MKQIKSISFFLIGLLFISACSSTKNLSDTNSNRQDGSSFENAISNAYSNLQDGSSFESAIIVNSIKAEYEWLAQNYPGFSMQMQALSKHKNKPYDILHILTANGDEKSIYFDISKFYGKF